MYSLYLPKIHSLNLQPLLVPCLFKDVFRCHCQTYIPVLVWKLFFPSIENFPLKFNTIVPNCIVPLNSVILEVLNSLFEVAEVSLFEVSTIKRQWFVSVRLFLCFNHFGKMRKKFGKVVKLYLPFDFLIVPSYF